MPEATVAIKFKSNGLKYAQGISKNIMSDAQAAAASAKDAAREAATASRQEVAQRGRLAARASKVSGAARGARSFAGVGFLKTDSPIEKFMQVANSGGVGSVAGRGVGQIAAGLAGGVLGGLILQVTAPLFEAVKKELDRRFTLMKQLEIQPFKLELERMRQESIQNRLKVDEEFQKRLSDSAIRLHGVQSSKRVVRTPGPLGHLG